MIKDRDKRREHRETVIQNLITACCIKTDDKLLASIEEVRTLIVDYELAITQLEDRLKELEEQ